MSNVTLPVKAVIYSDGGFQSKFGSGGWGIHGYTYVEKPPTKGTGNPKAIPTKEGYATVKDPDEKVTIVNYVDGVGGVPQANSSTQTELVAAIKAMDWSLNNENVHSVTIISDSRGVVDGMNEWLPRWKNNGWRNSRGDEVANKDLWLKAEDLLNQIRNREKNVTFQWIKGHDGFFGNEMADSYATKGNLLGRQRRNDEVIRVKGADGYWAKKNDYHKLLGSGRWYFSTIDHDYKTPEGETIYYLGDLLEDDHSGKPVADNANAVVYMKEPDPVLEKLRGHAMENDKRKLGSIMMGRLDAIFAPGLYEEIQEHGPMFLATQGRRLDLLTAKGEDVLKQKSPPGLTWLAIDALNFLKVQLDRYLKDKESLVTTDILPVFYDQGVDKKGRAEIKLKKDINSSTKFMDIPMNYSTEVASKRTESNTKQKKVRLILGIDVPKRNTLAGIAEEILAMEVISWRESDHAVRHACVIITHSGVGIWAGVDANLTVV